MDPPLYLSLLSLYNFYVILISYLYAPITGEELSGNTTLSFDIPGAEKERRQIMNAFYETELKNDDETLETNRSFAYEDTDSLATGLTSHRRETKKPPKEKAKEKLWESIVI